MSARQRHKQYWGAKLTAAVGWYGSAFATPHQYNKTTMIFCKLLSLLIFIYVCIRKSHLPPSNLKPRLKILQAHFVCSIELFPHLNKVSIVNGRVTLRVPCCSRSLRLKKLSCIGHCELEMPGLDIGMPASDIVSWRCLDWTLGCLHRTL